MGLTTPLRRIWKGVWNTLGYELYPTRVHPESIDSKGRLRLAPVRTTMEQSLRHLRRLDFVPDTIVDVGAADGTPELPAIFPEARFIWFEPQEFAPRWSNWPSGTMARCTLRRGPEARYHHPACALFRYGSSVLPEVDIPGRW